jgi:Kef-type K+ transport system membrane component KefB
MSLSTADVAHLLIALALLVLFAHMLGHGFAMLRQPPVIGEIAGGLLLGPTVLGAFAPGVSRWMFASSEVTTSALGAVYEVGLLLLMFLVGTELQFRAVRGERRTVAAVTSLGLVVPFAVGLLVSRLLDHRHFTGPHGSSMTFGLIFAIAIAVTSIPVISRIMMDLGILDTVFARIVLTVAVLEDLALYVALAVVLGLAQANSAEVYGLWSLAGTDSVALTSTYYVTASLVFLASALASGAWVVRKLSNTRFNFVTQRNPTAFRLLFLFAMVLACVGLGINPIFGALVAGIACVRADESSEGMSASDQARAWTPLKQFSLAFFVPIYFAIVGLKLDLIHNLDIVFFCWFFVLAGTAKALSVWAGARLAGEKKRFAVDLAIAMNARGGPGIVLATVTFSAGIVNEGFFTALVLLSIFTSQIAGFWLDRTFVRRVEPEQVAVLEDETVR